MKRRNITVVVFLLFIINLYLVGYSPWSSNEVKQYNLGYGVFDMKSYDSNIVYHVLDHMSPPGFDAYQKYLIIDNLFTVIFCILQVLLLTPAYRWSKSKLLHTIVLLTPIIRMLCDLTENISLNFILKAYPLRHDTLINFTSVMTKFKLKLVFLWVILMAIGYIMLFIKNRQLSEVK